MAHISRRVWASVAENPHKKICSGCRLEKTPSEYPANNARYDGLANYCCECMSIRNAKNRRKERLALLEVLGGKCARCGFDDWRALQIDHVNGDGALDRAEGRGPSRLRKLVRENPERFQILCANCNAIKKIENQEHRAPETYRRTVRTERIVREFAPPKKAEAYSRRRTEASEARQAECAALVEQRRPLRRSPHSLPPGNSWSRWYSACLLCEGTDRKHAADGLCWKCNKLVKGLNRRVSVYAAPEQAQE